MDYLNEKDKKMNVTRKDFINKVLLGVTSIFLTGNIFKAETTKQESKNQGYGNGSYGG